MVLGVGTGSVIGIVGGLFHMINHAMYKSCLFLTAGSVEKQAGTTSLEKLSAAITTGAAAVSSAVTGLVEAIPTSVGPHPVTSPRTLRQGARNG